MQIKFPGLRQYCEELFNAGVEKRKAKKMVSIKFPQATEAIIFANMKHYYPSNTKELVKKEKLERINWIQDNKSIDKADLKEMYINKFMKSKGTFLKEYILAFPEKKQKVYQSNKKKKKVKTRTMFCNMPKADGSRCNKEFESELDKMGIPYNHRCPQCSDLLKRSNEYNVEQNNLYWS